MSIGRSETTEKKDSINCKSQSTKFQITDLWIGFGQTFLTDLLDRNAPWQWLGEISNGISSRGLRCTDIVTLDHKSSATLGERDEHRPTSRSSLESTRTWWQYFLNALSIFCASDFSSSGKASKKVRIVLMHTEQTERESVEQRRERILPSQCRSSASAADERAKEQTRRIVNLNICRFSGICPCRLRVSSPVCQCLLCGCQRSIWSKEDQWKVRLNLFLHVARRASREGCCNGNIQHDGGTNETPHQRSTWHISVKNIAISKGSKSSSLVLLSDHEDFEFFFLLNFVRFIWWEHRARWMPLIPTTTPLLSLPVKKRFHVKHLWMAIPTRVITIILACGHSSIQAWWFREVHLPVNLGSVTSFRLNQLLKVLIH